MRIIRWILAVVLVAVLSGCSMGGGPNRALVEKAIALQLDQTQQELIQQLYPRSSEPPTFDVSHVKIKQQQPLKIQDLQAYRVQGTYDLTLEFPNRHETKRQSPFDIYVQRQIEGKTWRLARLEPGHDEGGEQWVTRLIQ